MRKNSDSKKALKLGPIDISILLAQRSTYEKQLRSELRLNEESFLKKNIISFHSEFAEFLEEWKQFKYWQRKKRRGSRSRQLEEYVDGLHIILTMFDEVVEKMPELTEEKYHYPDEQEGESPEEEIIEQILLVYEAAAFLHEPYPYNYIQLMQRYLRMGHLLGYSWDEVLKAFQKKLGKNIKRLNDGY